VVFFFFFQVLKGIYSGLVQAEKFGLHFVHSQRLANNKSKLVHKRCYER